MKRENFNEAEIAKPSKMTDIGLHAQAGDDAIAGGALGWPAHWARITVAKKTSDIVSVSPGEYHNLDMIYGADEAIDVNLQSYKPIVVTDERWMALILRGSEETIIDLGVIETSEQPLVESIPVNTALPKTVARKLSVIVQQGSIAPPPAARPVINEDNCCIAFVRLTSAGIQDVVANDAGRVKTVYEIEVRVSEAEASLKAVAAATVNIETTVASLAAAIKAVPNPRLWRQYARDIGRLLIAADLPTGTRNYYFDQGLLRDFWDFSYAGADFRIREGIRFPYQIQREAPLRLLNSAASDIKVYDNRMVLPAYTERTVIENVAGSLRIDIANTQHTVTTATQQTVSHEAIRYGETINVCENQAGWSNVADRKAQEIFAVGGQEFVSLGLSSDPWNNNAGSEGGHKNFSAQHVIRDSYETTYTTYHTENVGLSGAIHAQSFICSNVTIATSIDLWFTRAGTEKVMVYVCALTSAGVPDFAAIIAKTEIAAADIRLNQWTNIPMPPTLFDQGKRYGWFTVTSGNHQLAGSTDNAYSGGSRFICSDGVYAMGDAREDFAFRINGAKFAASRTIVPFENLQLTGGMSEVEMIYRCWQPDFTALVWEVKPEGATEWVAMDGRTPNAFVNLPSNCQLRAVFVGTESVAPMIMTDSNAIYRTGRMKHNMKAISKLLAFEFPAPAVQMTFNVDAYDADDHDYIPKLIVGGVVVLADSIEAEVDQSKPSRTKITAKFDFDGSPVSSARVAVDGSAVSNTDVPFIQDLLITAF